MRTRSLLILPAAVLLLTSLAAGRSLGAGPDAIDEDLDRLRTAQLPTDPAELDSFLRLRTRREPSSEALGRLVEALHATTSTARRRACVELVAVGKPALPRLRAVVPGSSEERSLVRGCVKAIENDAGTLTVAAVRVIAHHRRPGTTDVLLFYLPHAENEAVHEALQEALNAVSHDRKGVADPTVVAALGDQHPSRRVAAVVALMQGNLWRHRDGLRKLLTDPSPLVRFHAGRALAQVAEPEAISTLISLLDDPDDQDLTRIVEVFLTEFAGETRPKLYGFPRRPRPTAREVWAKWWRDTEGPSLLEDLKSRTPTDGDRARAQALIGKLGDESYSVRQRAARDLILLEERALPLLKRAVEDPPDLETRKRSEICIASIEKAKDKFRARLPALARLLALRRPQGTAEAILAYLPYLEEDGLSEDLQHTLGALVLADGKPPRAILEGLNDKSWIRRSAAAGALCAGGRTNGLEAVRRLLEDKEPAVRLKAAALLTRAGDSAGVPSLISMVAELPADYSAQAEDFLSGLAGEAGPKDLPEGEGDQKARSAAWAAWWRANEGKVVLADPALDRFTPSGGASVRGYTLLVQPGANTVTELGRDGKPRWSVTGLQQPRDAVVLADGRLIVAEIGRVTERNLRGKVLWQKSFPQQPLSVQRLRNGNLFVTCPSELIEVSRSGKEVQKVALSQGVVAARKLPDGRMVAFSNGNEVVQLDRAGREVKRTAVMCGGAGCNEVLDNGHVLALSPGNGNIIEFDIDGKEINRYDVSGAAHGFRLPNGHTLVTVNGIKYIELDRKFQALKETQLPGPAFRVKRR